jgi:hypothetical protein
MVVRNKQVVNEAQIRPGPTDHATVLGQMARDKELLAQFGGVMKVLHDAEISGPSWGLPMVPGHMGEQLLEAFDVAVERRLAMEGLEYFGLPDVAHAYAGGRARGGSGLPGA